MCKVNSSTPTLKDAPAANGEKVGRAVELSTEGKEDLERSEKHTEDLTGAGSLNETSPIKRALLLYFLSHKAVLFTKKAGFEDGDAA